MNLKQLTLDVTEIASKVGTFIKTERENFDSTKIETKGHSSNLVSYVDKESENQLVSSLKKLIPNAGFITEEATIKQRTDEEYYWLIDPLDGTTNFLHNVPLYSTSIGLMQNDTLIAGVILDITRNEMFYAWKEGGAYLNGKKIECGKPESLSKSLIATGFPYYDFEKMDSYINILKDLIKNSHGLRRCGSAAIDLAWVASGRFDGYFEYNINSWDIAAGCLILQEAGGKSTNFKGEDKYVFERNIVAGAATIHHDFQNIVAKNWF